MPLTLPAAGGGAKSPASDTAWLGMVIFLGSWAMMFAALFFVVGALRMRMPAWPPEGVPQLPRLLPALNTAVIAASSLSLQRALNRAREGRSWRGGLAGTLALGVLFVALQVVLWQGLKAAGIHLEGGILAGSVYGLTGLHALHVGVGLLGLAWVLGRRAQAILPLQLWTLYWHFVGLAWLVIAALLFIA